MKFNIYFPKTFFKTIFAYEFVMSDLMMGTQYRIRTKNSPSL